MAIPQGPRADPTPLTFGAPEAAPSTGGLFGGAGFGDDQFAKLLMGLALLDSGRPRVNPPSAMETIAPLVQMLGQQSNQKNAMNFMNKAFDSSAPNAAGLAAAGVGGDTSPDASAYAQMPGQVAAPGSMAPSGMPAGGMVAGGAIPGAGVGERVAATLRARGWSDAAIEGALNNAMTESSLNPNATGAAGEKGLFQLHPKSHINPFTQAYGGDWSPEAQANYIADTVDRSMPSYKLAKDGSAATADFMLGFERPKNQSGGAIAARAANGGASRAILARVGDTSRATPIPTQAQGQVAPIPTQRQPMPMRLVSDTSPAEQFLDQQRQKYPQFASTTPQTMTDASPGRAAPPAAGGWMTDANMLGAPGGPRGLDYVFGKTIPRPTVDAQGNIVKYAVDPMQAAADRVPRVATPQTMNDASPSRAAPPADAPPPAPVQSSRAAVGQAFAAGDLPGVSTRQVQQAQAAMPNGMPPRSPETVTGPRTQVAYATKMFEHWGRVAAGAGMLGTGGAGLVEYAKAQMGIAAKFLEPTDLQKNIALLPKGMQTEALVTTLMQHSPTQAGQTQLQKNLADLQTLPQSEKVKQQAQYFGPGADVGLQTALASGKAGAEQQAQYLGPGADVGLQSGLAQGKQQAELDAKLDSMGYARGTPERAAAARNMQPNSQPASLQEAGATMGNPALKNEILDLKRAGANNVTQKVEGQGQAALVNAGIKAMEEAHQGELVANKRTQTLGQMALAMQGFQPGATAELKLRGQSILKDIGVIKGENVPDAEIFQQAARHLQLAAAPKGQGSTSNYEREIFSEAVPKMTNSPESLAKSIDIARRLDDYDRKVAQIYRDSARDNGGLPNYVEAQQRIAKLGPPLSPGETDALEALSGRNQGVASAPASTAASQQQSGQAAPPIGSIDTLDALKEGQSARMPDGRWYRREGGILKFKGQDPVKAQ